MGVDFDRFTRIAQHYALLQQYLNECGIKFPLMQALRKRPEGRNIITIMDVKYDSYSLHVEFPKDVLQIAYTGVQFQFMPGRWFTPGLIVVNVEMMHDRGELEERANCTEAPLPYLDQANFRWIEPQ